MGLALGINRFEKDLKESELAEFLSSLVQFGLLPTSVPLWPATRAATVLTAS